MSEVTAEQTRWRILASGTAANLRRMHPNRANPIIITSECLRYVGMVPGDVTVYVANENEHPFYEGDIYNDGGDDEC